MRSPPINTGKGNGIHENFFRQLSFRRKLLISFVTLSCIPVLLAGIAAYHLYTNFIINMTEKSSIETIDLVCDDIDSLLNDAWNLCGHADRRYQDAEIPAHGL